MYFTILFQLFNFINMSITVFIQAIRNSLIILIPIALIIGLTALYCFLWALKSDQYDDIEGNSKRILNDDENK